MRFEYLISQDIGFLICEIFRMFKDYLKQIKKTFKVCRRRKVLTQVNTDLIGECLRELMKKGDATSSWSGFNYQGNVTIYTAICLLNKIGTNEEEIRKYEIEIEQNEDFSIYFNGELYSLHQVKSYQQGDTITKYSEAILQLFAKAICFPTVTNISLHTATEISNFTENDLIDNLKNFKITNLSETKRNLYSETIKVLFERNQFSNIYKLFKYNKSYDGYLDVELAIPLEDINQSIALELEKFYTNHHKHYNFQAIEQYKFAYTNILSRLIEMISQIHDKTKREYKIKLIDLYRIITNQNVFDFTHKTMSVYLKKELYSLFEQYCEDQEYSDDKQKEINDLWLKHWKIIEGLTDDEFILLCRRLSPDVTEISTQGLNAHTFRYLLNPSGVRRMLFFCLFELSHKIIFGDSVKNYLSIDEPHKPLLTLIDRVNPNTVGRDIVKNLKDDKGLFDLLFDNKYYLTESMDAKFAGKRVENLPVSEIQRSKSGRIKEKFTLPREIYFISKGKVQGGK